MKNLIKTIAVTTMVLLAAAAQAKYNGIPTVVDGVSRALDARDAVLQGGEVELPVLLTTVMVPEFNIDFTSAHNSLTNMNDRLLSGNFNLTIR